MDTFYTSATKALKLFKEKKLSPVELMKAIIKRSEKINQKTLPSSQPRDTRSKESVQARSIT